MSFVLCPYRHFPIQRFAKTLISAVIMATAVSCASARSSLPTEGSHAQAGSEPIAQQTVTDHPQEIDEILFNPGMGFADVHFGIGSPPLPPSQHPRSTVAYLRWSWADLEPAEGQYNFGLVDDMIQQAKAIGETLT